MPVSCSIVCAKPGRSRHGPVSPNAGMRTITDVGPDRAHDVVVEAELLEHPRREVLDDDVALRDELLREREAVGVTEVERDAALAEVHRVEQRRHLVELRVLARPHRRR